MKLTINFFKIARSLIFFTGFLVIFSVNWSKKNFGTLSFEQVLFHISFFTDLLRDSPKDLVLNFVYLCVLPSFIFSVLFLIIEKRIILLIDKYTFSIPKNLLSIIKLLFRDKLCFYLLLGALYYAAKTYDAKTYIMSFLGEDFFAKDYINPSDVKIDVINNKNLILLYAESIENAYKNEKIFNKNLLSKLEKVEGFSFHMFRQVPGTNWTAASVVATQCGIPLKTVSIYEGHAQGESLKYYLPSAVCLGDILKKNGYKNIVVAGANLELAGIDKFFRLHGYDEVYGKKEWDKEKDLHKNISEWGLHDSETLEQAKIKLMELQASKTRFNLTVMTIDTHGPNGKISPNCKNKKVESFEEIIACSTDQIADFLSYVIDNDYLENTNIVVIGDHFVMSEYIEKKLAKAQTQRSIFNKFISKDKIQKNREEILHFDLFPTILDFIGFSVENGRLGLGYSAISSEKHFSYPADWYQENNQKVLNISNTYLKLWQK